MASSKPKTNWLDFIAIPKISASVFHGGGFPFALRIAHSALPPIYKKNAACYIRLSLRRQAFPKNCFMLFAFLDCLSLQEEKKHEPS